jgi:F0F1-type ATP synthase assembly protein I
MLLTAGTVEVGMSRWAAALRLLGVGFFIGGSILLGVFAGRWLDTKLNSEPLWMLVGLFLGLAIALYGVYRMLLPFMRNKQDKENS